MAAGAALVAADNPGGRDYVVDAENALLSEPRDVEALAANLVRALTDVPLRIRLRQHHPPPHLGPRGHEHGGRRRLPGPRRGMATGATAAVKTALRAGPRRGQHGHQRPVVHVGVHGARGRDG